MPDPVNAGETRVAEREALGLPRSYPNFGPRKFGEKSCYVFKVSHEMYPNQK